MIRNLVRQLATPDHIRGRMTSVNMIFFLGGPQLGRARSRPRCERLGTCVLCGFRRTRVPARNRPGRGTYAAVAPLPLVGSPDASGGAGGKRVVDAYVTRTERLYFRPMQLA